MVRSPRCRFTTTIVALLLLLGGSVCGDEPRVFRIGNEIVVRLPQLDLLRQSHKQLKANLILIGDGGRKTITADLANRAIQNAIVIDIANYGACTGVSLEIQNGMGQVIHAERVLPVPTISTANDQLALSQNFAAIELGSQWKESAEPRIALPDVAKMRTDKLTAPKRSVALSNITYPVIADEDLPGVGSTNAIIVSRQSFAPDDASKCSLYFSYRKPLFDSTTNQLKEWRKLLVEVPLEKEWLNKQGDETILLPLDRFAIHSTDEKEIDGNRWNSPDGYNMLGGSSTGLFQGGQTVDVDDLGRIYISNVPDGAGIVRFNPHTGKFEQPPINFNKEARKLIPPDSDWKRSWDAELGQIVCTRGRIYIVFDRNYRVKTPNGNFETCSGVVSIPQEHWQDAEKFSQDIRLHAACWPSAKHPLYRDEVTVGSPRRAGPPIATTHGIAFGTFRLDLDAEGNTQRIAEIKNLTDATDLAGNPLPKTEPETIKGLKRQRFINVGAAGRKFVAQSYGELVISRAALALTMPDAPAELIADSTGRERLTFPGAPTGGLTVRFDITAKIKSDSQRLGSLASSQAAVSQGPAYAVIPIPQEPGQAIAVCDYNYFLSKLDFSRLATDRKVFKSYLTQTVDGRKTGFPVAAGLGPYNTTWIEHDDSLWLYIPGYTGMTRLKYSTAGRPVDAYAMQSFHHLLRAKPIDGVGRESVKDFLHILPTIDGRLIDIGRGRVGRGGGARSAGLELFDPRDLGASQTLVEMNRCYGLMTPVSRVVYSLASGEPRQELFVASGTIRPEYVLDIDDPARRPKNQDPKIFVYEHDAQRGLQDRFGFSLPLLPKGLDSSSNVAMSPCSQYLVALQEGGSLLAFSVSQRRFVDAVHLRDENDQPVHPLSFIRPSAHLWTAPTGQIFFHTALESANGSRVNFYEVTISSTGKLNVVPHMSVTWTKDGRVQDFQRIVRCFLPDLANQDGSYDLVLGADQDNGGQPNVRVIDDFLGPKKK